MSHHEKAVEAAALAYEENRIGLLSQPNWMAYKREKMRAAIAAFLENVEPSEGMRFAGMAESVKRALMLDPGEYDALFAAMSKALAEELKAP